MSRELPLLRDAFTASATRRAQATALVCGKQRLSYAELAQRVQRVAAALHAAGVKAGDRVLLFLDNGIEFVEALYAALHIGAVFVPVSPQTKATKLAYLLQDTRAAALLTHTLLQPEWAAALKHYPGLRLCCVAGGTPPDGCQGWPEGDAAPVAAAPIDAEQVAALIYTSGTTGVPKGVMLTHRNMRAAWR